MRPEAKRTLLAFAALSLAAAWLGMRLGALAATRGDLASGLAYALDALAADVAARPLAVSLHPTALALALSGCVATWCAWAVGFAGPRNFRAGEEHGSARWGEPAEGAAFANRRSPDDNILLTERYAMATRRDRFDLAHDRNLNVLVVGGSGSGKTRFYVKPNLMQLSGNYFLTDPKGTLLAECGHLFADSGYEVRLFATVPALFGQSLCYNPLAYVRTDAEVLSFVGCLIANVNGKRDGGSEDPFWENAEKLLLVALVAFLRDWMAPEDYTLPNVLYLLSLAEAREDDEGFQSALDLLFAQIETGRRYRPREGFELERQPYDEASRGLRPREPQGEWDWGPSALRRRSDGACPAELGGMSPSEDFALSHYKAFKSAAGKTLKSILIQCNTHLEPIGIAEVSRILSGAPGPDGEPTGRCELGLDGLGEEGVRAALFAVPSDTDRTFSFLHAILMWQVLNVLCDKALSDHGGRLPTLVSMVLDEFANIGIVPDVDKAIAVTRSRNVSLQIIVQSLAQLSANYGDDAAKVIRGNCDTQLFLGGTDLETNKEVSELIGNETVTQHTWSQTKGASPSWTKSYQTQSRALMDAAEVGLVPRDEAIVLIKGARPLRDRKYRLEAHPRYALVDPGHAPVKGVPAIHQEPFDYAPHAHGIRGKWAAAAPAARPVGGTAGSISADPPGPVPPEGEEGPGRGRPAPILPAEEIEGKEGAMATSQGAREGPA